MGGLYVAEETWDERRVGRELRTLDPLLFLDKEFDTSTGRVFYTVKFHRGDRPPDLILDWRDGDDTPLPLTSGLLLEIRRMMERGPLDPAEIRRSNERARERQRRESESDYRTVAEEWEKFDSAVRSGLLPRGTGLRMARDKQRARGRKL